MYFKNLNVVGSDIDRTFDPTQPIGKVQLLKLWCPDGEEMKHERMMLNELKTQKNLMVRVLAFI